MTQQELDADKLFHRLIAEGVHPAQAGDLARATLVPPDKRCSRCDGTGNELLSMFKACQACGGDGISKGNESQFQD